MSTKMPGTRLLTTAAEEEEAEQMLQNLERQQSAIEGIEKIIRNQKNSGELLKLRKRIQTNDLPTTIQGQISKTNKNSLIQQINNKIKGKSEVLPNVRIPSRVNISNVALEGISSGSNKESTNGSLLGKNQSKKPGMFGKLAKAVGAFGRGTQKVQRAPGVKGNGTNNTTARQNNKSSFLAASNSAKKQSIGTGVQGVNQGQSEFQQELANLQVGLPMNKTEKKGWTNNQVITKRSTNTKKEESSLLQTGRNKGYNESSLFTPSTIVTAINNPLVQKKQLEQTAKAARTQATILAVQSKSGLTGQEQLRANLAAKKANAQAKAAEKALQNAKLKTTSSSVQSKPPTTPIPPYMLREMEARRRALLARTGMRRVSGIAKNKNKVSLPGEIVEEQQATATVGSTQSVEPPITPQRRGLALGPRAIGRNKRPSGTSQTTLLQAQPTTNLQQQLPQQPPLTIQAPSTYEQKLEALQQRLSLDDEQEFMRLLELTESDHREQFINSLSALPVEQLHTTLNPPSVTTIPIFNSEAIQQNNNNTRSKQQQNQQNLTSISSTSPSENQGIPNTSTSMLVQQQNIISNVPPAKTNTFGATGGPLGEQAANTTVSEAQRRASGPSGPGAPVVSTTAATSGIPTSLPFAQPEIANETRTGTTTVTPVTPPVTTPITPPVTTPITPPVVKAPVPATIQKIGGFDFSENPEKTLVQWLMYGNQQEANKLITAFTAANVFDKFVSLSVQTILKKVENMASGQFEDADIVLDNEQKVNIEASKEKIINAIKSIEASFQALGVKDRNILLEKNSSYASIKKNNFENPLLQNKLEYVKTIRDSIVEHSFNENDIAYIDETNTQLDPFKTIETLKQKLAFFQQADMSIFGNYFDMANGAKKRLQAELNKYTTQQTQFSKDNLQKALGKYTIERNQAFEQNDQTNLNKLVQQLDDIASLTYWSESKKKLTPLDRTIERYVLELDNLDKQTVISRNETARKYMVYLYNCLREAIWKKAEEGTRWENLTAREINTYRVKVENLLKKYKLGSMYLYPIGTPLTQEQKDSLSMVKTNDERYTTILQASDREVLEYILQEFTVYLFNIQKTTGSFTNVAKRAVSSLEQARKAALQKMGYVPTVTTPATQLTNGPKRTVMKYQQKQDSKALLEETKRILEELKGLIEIEVKQFAEFSSQKDVEQPVDVTAKGVTGGIDAIEGVTESVETTGTQPEVEAIETSEKKLEKKRIELLKDDNTKYLLLLLKNLEENKDEYPNLYSFLDTSISKENQENIEENDDNSKIILSILRTYIQDSVDNDNLQGEIEKIIQAEEENSRNTIVVNPLSSMTSTINSAITQNTIPLFTNPILADTKKVEELKRKQIEAKAKEAKVAKAKEAKAKAKEAKAKAKEANVNTEEDYTPSANPSKLLALQAMKQYQEQNPRRQSRVSQLFSKPGGTINVNSGEVVKGGKRNNKTSKRRQAKRNHSWRKK